MTAKGLIVHEWIERIGGAERVVDAFAALQPEADLFCLWNDHPERFRDGRVHESRLARTPLRGRKAASLPVMPAVWRHDIARLGTFDWALVSSHLFAHHARVPGVAPERQFTYAHTPARYLWTPELDERGQSAAVRAVAPFFRGIDRRNAAGLQNLAVVSEFVRERVARTWGVDSVVIAPPVDVKRVRRAVREVDALDAHDRHVLESMPDGFVLSASRFVPYKRLDVAIAAGEASGRPVVIAGSGPDEARLRALAVESPADVRIVIAPSDQLLACLLERASVFVVPAVEDFGIMPVEAMAAGTPAVVYREGGASDSVELVGGGVVVESLEGVDIAKGLLRAIELDMQLVPDAVEAHFGDSTFRSRLTTWMAEGKIA